ncbi:YjcQ family protein [Caproicibacterium sp. XB1]|uniref:YjcQ family protein n=1 Tax=Caproicibacterium sp. XB1 TaxID=3396405 RepID=UPI0039B6EC75
MDNFRILYKILRILEKAMDVEEFDSSTISAESLKISEARWCNLMEMLSDEGYVKGVHVSRPLDNEVLVSVSNPRITLKGLEYLQENSLMKKAANLAKGVADIIP